MVKRSGWLLLIAAIIVGITAVSSAAEAEGSREPRVTLQDSGLMLEWQLPPLTVSTAAGAAPFSMPGFTPPDGSLLPQHSWLLALPPEGAVSFTIHDVRTQTQPLPESFIPLIQEAESAAAAAGKLPVAGQAFTTSDHGESHHPITLTEIGNLRGVRLARLTLTPAQPQNGTVLVVEKLTVTIDFGTALPTALETVLHDNSGVWSAVELLNPEQIRSAPRMDAAASRAGTAAETAVLTITTPGIHTISYADLAAAGFPVDAVPPRRLQLSYRGAETALEWLGDGDDQFESGEMFRFYVPPWADRWEQNAPYLLRSGQEEGERMGSSSGAPDGLTAARPLLTTLFEEDNLYTPNCLCGSLPPGRDGDRWVWTDLRRPGRPSADFSLSLPGHDTSQNAELTLWHIGFTSIAANPDHAVQVNWNGANLGTITWDGKTAVTSTLTIPAAHLQANNTLTLSLPEQPGVALDGLWLDAVQVRGPYGETTLPAGEQQLFTGQSSRRAYTLNLAGSSGAAVYDVTDPQQPQRLGDVQLVGSSISWGDPANGPRRYIVTTTAAAGTPAAIRMATPLQTVGVSGADYIIITPVEFMAAVAPLRELRQKQGSQVVVEDVQAIYDQFGDGRADPQAIRAYLQHAYDSWQPRPAYILLVGDGTSDPKQNHPLSKRSWIHPYLADVDPWAGEVAADNRFVLLDGDDILPDMIIGRLPANSVVEAADIVAKITAYEEEPAFGDWNGRFLSITDDTDGGGNFATHSDYLLVGNLRNPWQVATLYFDTAGDAALFQNSIKGHWNAGPGIIMYNGHSSIHQWGAERFFHLDDVAALTNGSRLPVILQMTCFTGSFQQPYWDTLDEALLRHPDGGAVAVWGAAGLGVGTGHQALADGFLRSLIINGNPDIGQAVTAGKLNLLTAAPGHLDLLDTFNLLGDPALQYNQDMDPGFRNYLPQVSNQ